MTSTLDWTLLFEKEGPRLRRFLRRFGPRISPEDVGQEAFANLYASRSEEITSPRAYLFRTARNLALNDLRHQRVAPTTPVTNPDALGARSSAPNPEEALLSAETIAAVNRAIAALPEHLRAPLLMSRLEGLSHGQIAQKLGLSRSTVKRYIAEALARCHLALADPPDAR